MNLYQRLQNELKNHRDFWNYYGMDAKEVLRNGELARDFIYDYFARGSKHYVLKARTDFEYNASNTRNMHTVNVFFIGTFLQRMIDEYLSIRSNVTSHYPFSYIWYLVCLAHDFGYQYESRSKEYLSISIGRNYLQHSRFFTERNMRFKPRENCYKDYGMNILYTNPPYGERNGFKYAVQGELQKQNHNIVFSNGAIIKRPRYSRTTINNYFHYRLNEMTKLDHGIVGADDFFSRLYINYVNEYTRVASSSNLQVDFSDFHNEQGLHFCSEQFKIFAYLADCIASHNIYKAGDDATSEKYKNYGLDCLVGDKFKPISYSDNPLLFILCVADTIEPSKRFPTYSNERLLKMLSVDYNADTNTLYIELDEKLYNTPAGKKYVADVEGLKDWCDIDVTVAKVRFGEENERWLK